MHHTPADTQHSTVWFSRREAGPLGKETFPFFSLDFFTMRVKPKEPKMHLFFIKLAKSRISVIICTIHNIYEYIFVTYYFQSSISFLRDLLYNLLLESTLLENHIFMYNKVIYPACGDVGINADWKQGGRKSILFAKTSTDLEQETWLEECLGIKTKVLCR